MCRQEHTSSDPGKQPHTRLSSASAAAVAVVNGYGAHTSSCTSHRTRLHPNPHMLQQPLPNPKPCAIAVSTPRTSPPDQRAIHCARCTHARAHMGMTFRAQQANPCTRSTAASLCVTSGRIHCSSSTGPTMRSNLCRQAPSTSKLKWSLCMFDNHGMLLNKRHVEWLWHGVLYDAATAAECVVPCHFKTQSAQCLNARGMSR